MILKQILVLSLMTNLGFCQTANLSTCGSAKSCYRNPDGCDGDCTFFVTWVLSAADEVVIEIGGSISGSDQYICAGLSRDQTMGDDSVIDCIETGAATPLIQMSYNPSRSNTLLKNPEVGFVSREGSFMDGQLYCKMVRTASPTVDPEDADKLFDLFESYYMLVSKGSYISGSKLRHSGSNRWFSSTKYNLTRADTSDTTTTETSNTLIAAHGCLMIVAWLLGCGIAVLLPRYFKDAWPDIKPGGKALWFQMHRALMILTLFLTVAGFVIIFVEVEGYAEYAHLPSKAHPPLGIITTILVIANPIMAAFRPEPNSSKRYIFNRAHSLVGALAHIFAVATIFISTRMAKSNIPQWGLYVMIVYVVWHFLIQLGFSAYRHVYAKRNDSVDIKMDTRHQQVEPQSEPQQTGNKGSLLRTVLLVVYTLGALAVALALLVQVAQA